MRQKREAFSFPGLALSERCARLEDPLGDAVNHALALLIAVASSAAFAQAGSPVDANSGDAAQAWGKAAQQKATVEKSKETAKMTTTEKNKAIKDANKQSINPDNPTNLRSWVGDDPRGTHREEIRNRKGRVPPKDPTKGTK